MNKQQKQLATVAVMITSFIWLAAMTLSYESQVKFALSIDLTSTIFGIQSAYVFPILTDSLIGASAVWSLLATLQGLNNIKYRIATLFFGLVTIWFNANSIDLSQATYTAIFAISWIPGVVIISTEMLLGYFQQQVELQREYISNETKLEHRIIALETVAKIQPNLALAVANEAKNDEIDQIQPSAKPSPLQLANEAKMAKKQANMARALELLNNGKSYEFIADDLDVTIDTVRSYEKQLNGSVKK